MPVSSKTVGLFLLTPEVVDRRALIWRLIMNEELKFQILQLCSGHYLTQNIPDDWYELTEEEQLEFISSNLWEPIENADPFLIKNAIESAATVTQHFIDDLLGI